MKNLHKIGKITKSVGLKGRIKVASRIESPQVLESLLEVYLKGKDNTLNLYRVKRISLAGKNFSLDLDGITDIDSARSLVGAQVFIPADKLEKLREDEYYWKDLIGLEVVTVDGRTLGNIEHIIATGSNDVYVCTGGEREILLPAIEDVIKIIDLKKGIMVVELLEGL